MSNAAFLVDGHLEKYVIQQICPKAPVNIINCNGDEVKLEAIANRLETLIRLLGSRYYPIVVVIDREDRAQKPDEISKEILSLLQKKGVDADVRLVVCDRMIENWILADRDLLSARFPDKKLRENYEGLRGKSEIKKLIPSYHETIEGVELMRAVRPKNAAKNSKSLSKLLSISADLSCPWMSR